MKISVIIPCYNSTAYIRSCLHSVLAQTMADFEVLLIDDGSTDDTLAIAGEYAQRDARIRVIVQENRGVSAARNAGLEHARGEWITFVDSDDLLTPDALEIMMSGVREDVDMVVCPHETFDARGTLETVIPQTRWMDKDRSAQRRAAALRLIEGDCVLNIMCGKLHRRSRLMQQNLRLSEGVKIGEDALFNLEAVLCGSGISYINRIAYRYRMHSASAMHRQTEGEMARHRPWLDAMRDMLLARGEMEAYFPAYVDSAALRLYKDGGVSGVMHRFNQEVAPMLPLGQLDKSKMTPYARALTWLCQNGVYPCIYPIIYPFQVLRRKAGEAAFALRRKKEMPQ